MIEEWYFCCCIKSSPDRIAAFLSTLDILENERGDSPLLTLAYQELQRAEVYMQIYALPRVLATLSERDIPENVRSVLKPYFDSLGTLLPSKESSEVFKNLLDSILQGPGSRKLRGAMDACLEYIPFLPSGRHPTHNAPYLDLKLFFPETLLLIVTENELLRNRNFVSALGTGQEEGIETVTLQSLVEEGLDHNLGRMAFCLAARISHMAGQSRKRIQMSIRRGKCIPSLEPDLLRIYVEAKYLDDLDRMNDEARKDAIHRLLTEALIFQEYNSSKFSVPGDMAKGTPLPLKIIGVDTIPDTIGLVYWQAALWNTAMRLDAKATAQALAKYWRPPVSGEAGTIIFECLFDNETRKSWFYRLRTLLHMPGFKQRPRIDIRTGHSLKLPGTEGCSLYSPWVYRQPNDKFFYSDVKKYGVLVRLAAACLVSVWMLRHLPKDFPYREDFAALIAHASHAFYTIFGKWLRNFREGKKEKGVPTLPPPLTGLTLFCHMHLRNAGCGRIETIAPGDFVELLCRSSDPDSASARNAKEREFYKKILPHILTGWILDAYGGAIGTSGPGRWIEYLPDVYRAIQGPGIGMPAQMGAACALRFLKPGDPNLNIKAFDWQIVRDQQNPLHWRRISPIQILLTQRDLEPEKWITPVWEEEFKNAGTRLARAVERCASLQHDRGDIDKETLEQWQTEWKDLLKGVDHLKKMDRFIRLRLLELLDNPVLEPDIEGQELIIQVIMEYGSAYDLNKLFKQVFFAKGWSAGDRISTTRVDLQKMLLRIMQNKIKELEFSAAKVFQDPRQKLREKILIDLINRTFSAITGNVLDKDDPHGISTVLKPLLEPYSSEERTIEAEIQWIGKDRRLTIEGKAVPMKGWMVSGAAVDPNRQRATLFYDDWETEGLQNLFECYKDEVDTFLRTEPGNTKEIFAMVVSRGPEYVFNCGPFYVSGRVADRVPPPGSGVSLKILKSKTNGNWLISPSRPVRRLGRKNRQGDIDGVTVMPFWNPDEERNEFRFRRHNGRMGSINLILWEAGIYQPFNRRNNEKPYSAWTRLESARGWVPMERCLNQLLLDDCVYQTIGGGKAAVLTYIESVLGPYGETAWRFAVRPGQIYLLYDYQFEPRSRDELYKAVSGESRAKGLIVTVTPKISEDVSLLALEERGVEDAQLDRMYPGLDVPFDDRNLKWEHLFSKMDLAIAEKREDGSWSVRLDPPGIPGYPDKAKMQWERAPRHLRQEQVQFQVRRWDRRIGVVKGAYLDLNFIMERYWTLEFYRQMRNIDKHARMILTNVINRVNERGYVLCRTKEGLLVEVKAESLTSRRLDTTSPIALNEDRVARLYAYPFRGRGWSIQVDPASIPHDVLVADEHIGFLVKKPRGRGTLCQVLWEKDDDVVPHNLQIANLAELDMWPGSKIIARRIPDGWDFTVEFLNLRAEALWTFENWDQECEDEPIYLGMARYQGKWRPIGELRPGVLTVLGKVPRDVCHLAPRGNGNYVGGLDPDVRTRISHRDDHTWPVKRKGQDVEIRRVVLTFGKEILPGNCEVLAPSGPVSVQNVLLNLRDFGGGYFVLDREFRVVRFREKVRPISHVEKFDHEKLKEDLTDYMNNPDRAKLDATYENGELRLCCEKPKMVPVSATREEWSSQPEKAHWTRRPFLAEDEGPFVEETQYDPENAKVWLFENKDGMVQASLRRGPHHTLEDFRDRENADFGDPVPLAQGLYYVRPETVHPHTGRPYGEEHHRFEWGYGETLLVPKSKLRYMGGPFDNAKFVLFHGDVITEVTFYPDTIGTTNDRQTDSYEDEGDDLGPSCIMEITASNIQFSSATQLYTQTKKYKIIHVLDLIYDSQRIRIDHVRGFDDRAGDMETGTRNFRTSRAVLSTNSEERLTKRMHDQAAGEKLESTILGRLNVQEFKDTRGRTLKFEHVRLSFKDSDYAPHIESGNLVFMQAGMIEEIASGNDTRLQVSALNEIDNMDVGDDMKKPLVFRRQFSAREDSLPNYLRAKGEDGLKGTILLVLLNQGRDGKVFLSLIRKMPNRKISALTGAPGFRKGLLLATVVEADQEKGLQLELQPGIFILLDPEKMADCPEDLTKGAIVRVERASNSRFRVIRAVFSDARYMPAGTRLAVALPKDNLLTRRVLEKHANDPDKFWYGDHFSIGGLPNVTAAPGIYDANDDNWDSPIDEEFTRLMEQDHPKIVVLGKDRSGRARLGLPPVNAPVGKLQVEEDGLKVSFKENGRELSWRFLSFGDESARSIIDRANGESWVYHDKSTGKWEDREPECLPVKPHDIWTGPIFFDEWNGTLRLRYDPEDFCRFGYPVNELVRSLESAISRIYPVAGISSAGGLWIELAPGRIVELPAQMITWGSGGTSKPLAHLNWEAFAPGDMVELAVEEYDILTPARVALRNWYPGPRAALGKGRCFLPLCKVSIEDGSVTLGAGAYILKLSVSENEQFEGTVITLDPQNNVYSQKQFPKQGDVVLLGIDTQNEPTIYGFPELYPRPEQNKRYVWKNDPFANDINLWDKYHFDKQGLAGLIRAAGGALPFTVEWITERGTVFLSRRHQSRFSHIPKGTISMGRVNGLLPDGKTALIRCGGGIVKMPAKLIVQGLPERFFKPVMEDLRQSGAIIWLRGEGTDTIQSGIQDESDIEIPDAKAVSVVTHGDEKQMESGMICRSHISEILYWMPESHVSYTRLFPEQMRRIFVEDQDNSMPVRLCGNYSENCFISVIEAREADWEFNTHSVESEMAVEVLDYAGRKEDGVSRYLVKSARTGVILECEVYEDEDIDLLKGQKDIRVEVIRRISGIPRLLTTAILGKKRMTLDLPSWMMQPLPEPGKKRVQFHQYIQLLGETDVVSQMEVQTGLTKGQMEAIDNFLYRAYESYKKQKGLDDEWLDQFLCRAYSSFENRMPCLKFQLQVAQDWVRTNRSKPEVAPQFAIMAILLLHGNAQKDEGRLSSILRHETNIQNLKSQWREMAFELTIDMGMRALRSMHLEVLSQKWLFGSPICGRGRTYGLWKRLNLLSDNIRSTLDAQKIAAIRHFSQAVRLRNDTELLAVSDALLASTGILVSIKKLTKEAEIINALSNIQRTLQPCRALKRPELHSANVKQLKSILDKIRNNEIDLTLLDPLPRLRTDEIEGMEGHQGGL